MRPRPMRTIVSAADVRFGRVGVAVGVLADSADVDTTGLSESGATDTTGLPDVGCRPRTTADCIDRPGWWRGWCPWVGCRLHLYLDVLPSGAVVATWPGLDPWECPATCALAVARSGARSQEGLARLLGLTQSGVARMEGRALRAARAICESYTVDFETLLVDREG